jgi:hypothetical protein
MSCPAIPTPSPSSQTDPKASTNRNGNEVFASGYQRDSREGKGRFDLIPFEALEALAKLFERGAKKYGESNWRKGAPISRYFDSMLRHALKANDGQTDEDHLAAVMWNAGCAIATRAMVKRGELPRELDDVLSPSDRSGLMAFDRLEVPNVINMAKADNASSSDPQGYWTASCYFDDPAQSTAKAGKRKAKGKNDDV